MDKEDLKEILSNFDEGMNELGMQRRPEKGSGWITRLELAKAKNITVQGAGDKLNALVRSGLWEKSKDFYGYDSNDKLTRLVHYRKKPESK